MTRDGLTLVPVVEAASCSQGLSVKTSATKTGPIWLWTVY